MASQIAIPLEELQRHVLTSTRAYWMMRSAPVEKRRDVLLRAADYARDVGLGLQEIACLRVALRLGADKCLVGPRIAELNELVDRQAPIAGLLPDEYAYVPHESPDYERFIDGGGFSRERLPLRNTESTIAAYKLHHRLGPSSMHRLDFILLRKGIPVSRVECNVALDGGVNEYNHPVRVQFAADAPPTGLFRIAELTLDVLKAIALRNGACDIQIDDIDHGPMQTPVARACNIREYLPELRTAPFVDLTQDEKAIWSGVRDSYRALIRTQGKAMELRRYGGGGRDCSVINGWRGLLASNHTYDSGKFDYAVERAVRGEGEILAGFLADGQCCSVAAISDDGPLSLYEAGNYLETSEWRKASHYPLYEGILSAKARGQSRLYLSYYGEPRARHAFDGETVVHTPKGRAIHFFKRGFSESIERKFVFRLVL